MKLQTLDKVALIALGALLATSTFALAHSNDARQAEQADWIEQGRQDGSITWREGIKLRREQAAVARLENHYEADGRLTRDEKRSLHQVQNQTQNHISREANDGWQRPWWLPRFGR